MIDAPLQQATTHISSNHFRPAVRLCSLLRKIEGIDAGNGLPGEDFIPTKATRNHSSSSATSRNSWPNLEYLNICLTARKSSIEAFESGPYCCSKLKSLGVSRDSGIKADPIVVPTFLQNIFTNLSTIRALENAGVRKE